MRVTYLDSSAIVKLVVAERESTALRQHLRRRRPLVSSTLARVEVLRSLLPGGEAALARGHAVLGTLDLIRVGRRVCEAAGVLLPAEVHSLDAIHLATAQQLGADLQQVVTYDHRMLEAAVKLGLRAATPT